MLNFSTWNDYKITKIIVLVTFKDREFGGISTKDWIKGSPCLEKQSGFRNGCRSCRKISRLGKIKRKGFKFLNWQIFEKFHILMHLQFCKSREYCQRRIRMSIQRNYRSQVENLWSSGEKRTSLKKIWSLCLNTGIEMSRVHGRWNINTHLLKIRWI